MAINRPRPILVLQARKTGNRKHGLQHLDLYIRNIFVLHPNMRSIFVLQSLLALALTSARKD
jgi:hypothetical protein